MLADLFGYYKRNINKMTKKEAIKTKEELSKIIVMIDKQISEEVTK